MKKIHALVGYFIFIVWIIIIADTGISNDILALSKTLSYGDKIGHFLLMGNLALLTNLSLNHRMVNLAKITLPLGSILIFMLVLAEEFSQIFISRRTFDLLDLAADFSGITFFSFVGVFWIRKYV